MRTVVLLHGWGMTPSVFAPIAESLGRHYELHPIALPGYCGAAPVEPMTIATLALDVAARAPERCVVAGWSLGGQVALEWARRVPGQAEALVLIGTTPSFVTRERWPHALEPRVLRGFADALTSDRQATLKRFASLQAQGDEAMKELAQRLRGELSTEEEADIATLRTGLSVLLETDLRETVGDVVQEALVVHGERDRLVPCAAGEHLAQSLKHGRLAMIAGAAHAPFVTQADAVAAALKEFLQ